MTLRGLVLGLLALLNIAGVVYIYWQFTSIPKKLNRLHDDLVEIKDLLRRLPPERQTQTEKPKPPRMWKLGSGRW